MDQVPSGLGAPQSVLHQLDEVAQDLAALLAQHPSQGGPVFSSGAVESESELSDAGGSESGSSSTAAQSRSRNPCAEMVQRITSMSDIELVAHWNKISGTEFNTCETSVIRESHDVLLTRLMLELRHRRAALEQKVKLAWRLNDDFTRNKAAAENAVQTVTAAHAVPNHLRLRLINPDYEMVVGRGEMRFKGPLERENKQLKHRVAELEMYKTAQSENAYEWFVSMMDIIKHCSRVSAHDRMLQQQLNKVQEAAWPNDHMLEILQVANVRSNLYSMMAETTVTGMNMYSEQMQFLLSTEHMQQLDQLVSQCLLEDCESYYVADSDDDGDVYGRLSDKAPSVITDFGRFDQAGLEGARPRNHVVSIDLSYKCQQLRFVLTDTDYIATARVVPAMRHAVAAHVQQVCQDWLVLFDESVPADERLAAVKSVMHRICCTPEVDSSTYNSHRSALADFFHSRSREQVELKHMLKETAYVAQLRNARVRIVSRLLSCSSCVG